jgi:N-succinyldiaminopimelate aminotransferase
MSQMLGLEALAKGAVLSPFTRLNRLLADITPENPNTIEMTAGDPKEVMPAFVVDRIAEAKDTLGTYPKIRGSDELRRTIAAWIDRRYGLKPGIDPAREVHPLNGSREGLFFSMLVAAGRKPVQGRPAVLMPNPFYQAYVGAAYGANCEAIFLNATDATGHMPDLDQVADDAELMARTVAFYLCSPANPQGAVASRTYLLRAIELARKHDFMLFFDECYSEIYSTDTAPTGALDIGCDTPERFRNIVVFNSLSKRSNLPGLRSGFAAGDGDFLETLAEVRNLTAPQMPGIIQHASSAVWAEEQHVAVIRQAYRAKFDVCDEILNGRFGYKRPAGGFFLWLNMAHLGNSVEAAVTLWKRCGVKVVPGAYLAQPDRNGVNPGETYIRVALVHPPAVIREALGRIVNAK